MDADLLKPLLAAIVALASPGLIASDAPLLASLTRHAASAGAHAASVRTILEGRLAADLKAPHDLSRASHRDLLVAAANAGSLAAASRLVDLGWFDAMRRVEVDRPELAVWSRSEESVGTTTAGALHAQLWINRLDGMPGISSSFRDQQQMEALEDLLLTADPSPMALLDAACVLMQDGEPEQVARARSLAASAARSLAAMGFDGDDLLLVEGRADAYLSCLEYLEAPDWAAARQLFAHAAAARAACGDDRGRGVMMRLEASAADTGGDLNAAEQEMTAAAELFARIGDHARRGRCLNLMGTWFQPDRDGSGDRAKAMRLFQLAAAASQRAGDWGGAGDSFASLAWCRYPDVPDRLSEPDGREPYVVDESDWGRSAAAFGAAAAAHGLDGDAPAQAHDLYSQGICLDPTLNPMGSWLFAIPIFEAAEAKFAASADTSARAWNLCVLGEALVNAGDRAGALPWLRQAAGLALSEGEQDLLERVQQVLSPAGEP
ncbi:MAG: hypothetical protein H0W83_05820 [Planctomycetes bacterium]|nr:hypothetical protein [Planctomycetota bacterium]